MANTKSLDLELSSSQYAYITDGLQTGLDVTGDMTMEFWVKLETALSGSYTQLRFITKYNFTGNQVGYNFDYIWNSGTPQLRWSHSSDGSAGTYAARSINQTIPAATWTHIAVTYDASAADCEFFVNGSSIGNGTGTLNTSTFNSNESFRIGADSSGNYLDGLIDDVRVWNDIRTSGEISNNYNKQLVGNEAGLVGYWTFNGNYWDKTSNNNDLVAVNAPVFSTDVPFVGGAGALFFAQY